MARTPGSPSSAFSFERVSFVGFYAFAFTR